VFTQWISVNWTLEANVGHLESSIHQLDINPLAVIPPGLKANRRAVRVLLHCRRELCKDPTAGWITTTQGANHVDIATRSVGVAHRVRRFFVHR
jgi:hypothetical protein